MKPYFDDGQCQCGCGGATRRRFISGHNLRDLERTSKHCASLSAAAKRAWDTKRERMAVGTRRKDVAGYVVVKVVPGKGHWRKEHHLVLESQLGRPLRRGEVVHHINGVKDDNRTENLHLCASHAEHQRAEVSYQSMLAVLLDAGLIVFREGVYRLA